MQQPISFEAITGSTVSDGIIRGVSVITEGEAEGHGVFIDSKTLLSVKACAETHTDGVKVKSEHGTDFGSIVGVLRNFRIVGTKLLADLHLLKEHIDFSRIVEMAKEMPSEIGLSISFSGQTEEINGEKYARCDELYSVDLVDRPAANPDGLFNQDVDSKKKGNMADKAESLYAQLKNWVGISENAELSASQKSVTELSEKVAKFEVDLKAANDKATKLEIDLKAAQAEVAALPEKIKTEGSREAQRIMASLGQPPVPTTPAANPASDKPAERNFKAEVKPLTGPERLALERK